MVVLPTTVEVLVDDTDTSTEYFTAALVALWSVPFADHTPVLAASQVKSERSARAPTPAPAVPPLVVALPVALELALLVVVFPALFSAVVVPGLAEHALSSPAPMRATAARRGAVVITLAERPRDRAFVVAPFMVMLHSIFFVCFCDELVDGWSVEVGVIGSARADGGSPPSGTGR